jgi:Zn-dependent alcohol dehydrogenase
VRLVREGRLQLASLIGKRYPLADINDAIDDMKSGRLAGRAIVRLGNP